ncbi:MAG: acyl-CoA carboxylase epsilon subunit [Actinomycetota bacterium]|nr:acyl-CoA carboxylase epsilon subunit [Actinomycetota bacterium]
MTEYIAITGGAGPQETAAITAVVAMIEAGERAAQAVRPKPIHQSQWVDAGRSAIHRAPLRASDKDRGSLLPPP